MSRKMSDYHKEISSSQKLVQLSQPTELENRISNLKDVLQDKLRQLHKEKLQKSIERSFDKYKEAGNVNDSNIKNIRSLSREQNS